MNESEQARNVVWKPNPGGQEEFCGSTADYVLFGGSRGPGKTDALIAEALRYGHIPDYKCLFLRRTFPNLSEVIQRTHKLYPKLGWKWTGSPTFMWKHPSGAFIQFGHVQREVDKYNYIGKEFQRIIYDQVERFTETSFTEINTTLRTTNKEIPTQVLASANPGGVGHGWVKQKWIDRCPSKKRGEKIYNEDFKMFWQPVKGGKPFVDENGESWEFHPALVFDNPQLMENDPKYVRKLLALPYESREAYLWGNWAVFVGQYFSEFRQDVHVLTMKQVPKIPSTWKVVGGCDYASSGWYFSGVAVMNHHKEIIFVEEDYFRGGSIRKKARRADRLIGKYPPMEKWVAPWDMYNKMRDRETDQSQGVIIDLFKKHMKKEISIVKAPKDRIGRWDLMRDGFSWSDGDKPWLYIRENCPKLIETIPAMIHKESDPEDLDPDGWTHGVDFMGYVLECMRREGIEPPLDAYDQESKRQSESKIISQYNWLEQ